MRACPVILMLVVLLQGATAVETADTASVVVRVDPATTSLGKEVQVFVDYRWPNTLEPVAPPDPAGVLDAAGIPVVGLPPPQEENAGAMSTSSWRLRVLAPRSGTWVLPEMELALTDSRSVRHVVSAPMVAVQVDTDTAHSALPPPRPLYSPPRPANPWTLIWILVFVVFILAVIGIPWYLRSRRSQPTIPPAEQFRRDLASARDTHDPQTLGLAVGAALRRYCGNIWGFDGLGLTAREMRSHIPTDCDPERRTALLRILDDLEGLCWRAQRPEAGALQPFAGAAEAWVEACEADRRRAAEEATRRTRHSQEAAA